MAATLLPASVVVATKDQVSTNLSGEAVILGMRNGVYYGLDPVGARIWALVQAPSRIEEVARAIVAEFDVSHETALADLLSLSAELMDHRLLEIVAAPPA